MKIDMVAFLENRAQFPPDELARYAGQWVAWSADGTRIVASSPESVAAVSKQLEEAGLATSEYVQTYVPAGAASGSFRSPPPDERAVAASRYEPKIDMKTFLE